MPTVSGYRTLIVGASSLQGKDLAAALRERRFPSRSLHLMESPGAEARAQREPAGGRLVAFDDEAELQTAWDEKRMADADVVFLCGGPEAAAIAVQAARGLPPLLVDLSGGADDPAEEEPATLIGFEPPEAADQTRMAVVAHPAAQALARLTTLAARAGAIDALAATVFEPASQRGLAAILELEKQTAGLLGVRSIPTHVFDAQVAFTLRAALGPEAQPSLDRVRRRIALDYRRQLEDSATVSPIAPAAIELLQAPLFHGSTLSVNLRYRKPPERAAVEAALQHSDLRRYEETEGYPDAPAAAGQDAIHLGPLRAEPNVAGSYWLFAICDNLRRTAFSAVDGALALLQRRR